MKVLKQKQQQLFQFIGKTLTSGGSSSYLLCSKIFYKIKITIVTIGGNNHSFIQRPNYRH